MIDRRELLAKARERNLNLNLVEKDYVLGWLLFGFSKIDSLIFKGGTSLSKIYFPKIWRLSEDLDFSLIDNDFSMVTDRLEAIFKLIEKVSGIVLDLKSEFSNPYYLQLKIQYMAVIGKNWIKADVTKNDLIDKPVNKSIEKNYSDYKDFKIKVESVEEIFCSKIRAVIERKKSRDYFDLWKLMKLKIDLKKVKKILNEKLKIKDLEFSSMKQIFPKDVKDTLLPYWKRELGRLVYPLPDLETVLSELKNFIKSDLLPYRN